MGSTRIDPYFYKQPELRFVDELRSVLAKLTADSYKEAEGYKFFPEKLRECIEKLNQMKTD